MIFSIATILVQLSSSSVKAEATSITGLNTDFDAGQLHSTNKLIQIHRNFLSGVSYKYEDTSLTVHQIKYHILPNSSQAKDSLKRMSDNQTYGFISLIYGAGLIGANYFFPKSDHNSVAPVYFNASGFIYTGLSSILFLNSIRYWLRAIGDYNYKISSGGDERLHASGLDFTKPFSFGIGYGPTLFAPMVYKSDFFKTVTYYSNGQNIGGGSGDFSGIDNTFINIHIYGQWNTPLFSIGAMFQYNPVLLQNSSGGSFYTEYDIDQIISAGLYARKYFGPLYLSTGFDAVYLFFNRIQNEYVAANTHVKNLGSPLPISQYLFMPFTGFGISLNKNSFPNLSIDVKLFNNLYLVKDLDKGWFGGSISIYAGF